MAPRPKPGGPNLFAAAGFRARSHHPTPPESRQVISKTNLPERGGRETPDHDRRMRFIAFIR